jgi:hypothetical protein
MENKLNSLKRIAAILILVFYLAMGMSFFFHHHSGGEEPGHSKACSICVAQDTTLHKANIINIVFCLEITAQVIPIYTFVYISSIPFDASIARAPPLTA